ncbi:MAG: sigma-70 family RNA polymerase sigma factor [Bacteroidota bacterium]|nr:sigma-70 family RNA polymerase sigma factor [Bacteroidota bacterium]MDX5430458.1 sigma-70 family RNA polymerase sigma factor [Bacteroidota bacterium]MDX5469219.1 sigma-70 family RNA polymerase sigma factor [Bacteroidota bacterium]
MDTPRELIDACIKGNGNAQEELYRRYKSKLMGIAMRYAGSREHAQDVLQEAFISILNKCKAYKGSGSFEGWMTRVVINTAISFNRKWEYRRNDLPDEQSEWEDYRLPADLQLQEKDLLALVQKLPAGYRTVFNMYVIDGYSHDEIAEQLSISASTSKTQLMKAKKRLADWIGKMEQKDMMR